MARIIALTVCLSLAALLSACGATMPVKNVEAAPVHSNKQGLTMEDVQKAILRAGAQYGWAMTPTRPGLIAAELKLRRHVAKVDIAYDTKSYSITYVDSVELQYDGTNIHKNYNGWIQNLENGIQVQLSTL